MVDLTLLRGVNLFLYYVNPFLSSCMPQKGSTGIGNFNLVDYDKNGNS